MFFYYWLYQCRKYLYKKNPSTHLIDIKTNNISSTHLPHWAMHLNGTKLNETCYMIGCTYHVVANSLETSRYILCVCNKIRLTGHILGVLLLPFKFLCCFTDLLYIHLKTSTTKETDFAFLHDSHSFWPLVQFRVEINKL